MESRSCTPAPPAQEAACVKRCCRRRPPHARQRREQLQRHVRITLERHRPSLTGAPARRRPADAQRNHQHLVPRLLPLGQSVHRSHELGRRSAGCRPSPLRLGGLWPSPGAVISAAGSRCMHHLVRPCPETRPGTHRHHSPVALSVFIRRYARAAGEALLGCTFPILRPKRLKSFTYTEPSGLQVSTRRSRHALGLGASRSTCVSILRHVHLIWRAVPPSRVLIAGANRPGFGDTAPRTVAARSRGQLEAADRPKPCTGGAGKWRRRLPESPNWAFRSATMALAESPGAASGPRASTPEPVPTF